MLYLTSKLRMFVQIGFHYDCFHFKLSAYVSKKKKFMRNWGRCYTAYILVLFMTFIVKIKLIHYIYYDVFCGLQAHTQDITKWAVFRISHNK